MKIIIVYNPKSGSALSREELRKKCTKADIEIEQFIAIKDGFEKKLKSHIENGETIAAVGGDGTISAVAGLLAHTKATLIPLPGGTLNHFTKDLKIPQNIDQALMRLKKCQARSIDIAAVENTFFINNSSMGLYPASLHDREELETTTGKWPAAVIASIRALIRFKTYTVTIDDHTFKTPFIFVGNNRYSLETLGGTERTSLDKGHLTVFAAKTQSRLTLLKIACFALIGKTKQLTEFDEFHPKAFTLKTKRSKLSVSHDGEVSKFTSPLKFEIHSKALKILG